ncbi:MAG: CotH kinase family protein [Crocinitomicaceae bacterium]
MHRYLLKIDIFSIMLLIGIIALYGFSGSIREDLLGKKNVLKKFQLLKDISHLPDSNDAQLFLYDENFEMSYSVNGGDSYIPANAISYESINLVNLYHYITSYRSKPVFGNQPKIKSVLVKAKHKTKDIFVEPVQVTFPFNNQHEIPILNIVTSEKGLFSNKSGILTLGQNSWINEGYYKSFWNRSANYKIRGDRGKRKSYWQYLVKGKVKFETQSDLQVSGNATRAFPQKSFKLKAHQLYGSEMFMFSFFGKKGLKTYASLVIRNSGNDNTKTLFADMLMHKLARKTNVLTQMGKAIVLYLNGNYWGIYNLRERLDIYMIAKKEKAKPEEITILEGANGQLKDGYEDDAHAFNKLILAIENDTQLVKFEEISNQIDLASFIDYILLETYYGNGDWLHNNALWFKVKNEKWRWILNDLDYGLAYQGSDNVNRNYFNYLKNNRTVNAKLFNYLISDKGFNKTFKQRAIELMNTIFTDKIIRKAFSKRKTKILSEINNHFNRWTGGQTYNDWEADMAANLSFLINRKSIFLKQIDKL